VNARALLAWFASHARPLPWREAPAGARDAFRVWVSEVMLQQTRVETVARYYAPFLAGFPDARALAAAEPDLVMKVWEGLGYYRRARSLQAGARVVVERHGGEVPRSLDELRALPGVGAYTAGAIASLAWGEPVAAVDGNVLRVFARQRGVAAPRVPDAAAWVLEHQPRGEAGAFNEALMELGATVCTPRLPRCDACPIAASCATRGDAVPRAAPRVRAPTVRVALALARRGDALLLERREAGLLAGTWGLPWVEVADGADARDALRRHIEALVGAPARVGEAPSRRGRHVFTHRKWAMEAYDVDTAGAGGEWRAPSSVALGTAHRRLLSKP
jgi:A/G-specific adenine glycosylase